MFLKGNVAREYDAEMEVEIFCLFMFLFGKYQKNMTVSVYDTSLCGVAQSLQATHLVLLLWLK